MIFTRILQKSGTDNFVELINDSWRYPVHTAWKWSLSCTWRRWELNPGVPCVSEAVTTMTEDYRLLSLDYPFFKLSTSSLLRVSGDPLYGACFFIKRLASLFY